MQNGKGDKVRPVKNYKDFLNRWDDIDWGRSKKTEKSSCKCQTDDVKYVAYEIATDSTPASAGRKAS